MVRRLLLAVCATALGGCATTVTGEGPDQPFFIDSTPQGATVIVDGVEQGLTPTRLTLDRRVHHDVRIELTGYEGVRRRLESGTSDWFWKNFFLLGAFPIGMTFDLMSGSWRGLSPDPLKVKLVAEK